MVLTSSTPVGELKRKTGALGIDFSLVKLILCFVLPVVLFIFVVPLVFSSKLVHGLPGLRC